ncbi:alpha/beta hydrolase [Dokdonella sp.]|uniref:alpha/beta hydrolase n=1 Tax=Dokdonella sp. TaxID=2291710 RepID=UPI00260D4B9C|nr:alpha/beta hydrolase [Dokdonella sp.]
MSEDESVLGRAAPAPDRTLAWGALPDQVADIRFGDAHAASRPLLAIVHGGFWRPLYDRMHTAPMAAALAAAGWTVASIEYRRIPGDPDASVADVRAALAALPAQVAGRHRGDVVAIGHSAGGHLALLAGLAPTGPLVGVLALSPLADLGMTQALGLSRGAAGEFLGCDADARADLDPARLRSPAVPTTILHGDADETVPLAMSRAYVATHADVRLRVPRGAGHYAGIDPLSPAWTAVVEEIGRFD